MKKYLKLASYALIGAGLGYAYYYYIGCANGGACPLTSRWYITTIYGFISGILIALPSKNKVKNEQASQ